MATVATLAIVYGAATGRAHVALALLTVFAHGVFQSMAGRQCVAAQYDNAFEAFSESVSELAMQRAAAHIRDELGKVRDELEEMRGALAGDSDE